MEGYSKLDTEINKPPDWLISNIAESSSQASKFYSFYIGFITYSFLSVIGTMDRQLILNDKIFLPILQMNVSVDGFFIAAPIIALAIFLYFQLVLHKNKSLIENFGSNCFMSGVSLATVQAWMGHASIETTRKHYGHLTKSFRKGGN